MSAIGIKKETQNQTSKQASLSSSEMTASISYPKWVQKKLLYSKTWKIVLKGNKGPPIHFVTGSIITVWTSACCDV